ncbi:MAG TPA: glycine zipper 2TM domain-containing protein [Rhodanobacteraceae bacterium]|nr:glycine zipper 2TM domain-containing protein [Rhodanobacteraceae bacterium]
MKRKLIPMVLTTGMLVGLAGCATYPPGYYDRPGYDQGYHRSYRHACANCGEVRDLDRVYVRDRTTGLGAVIGAIAGGVLGSTIGKGNGRTAATVGGAVAGGVAGNAIERNSSNGGDEAWRFHVRLEDGRWATVTQLDRYGLRRGDEVVIRGNHVEPLRR